MTLPTATTQLQQAVTHCKHAGSLLAQGQYAQALDSYDRAIALKPDFAQAHNNRGVVLEKLKQHAAALQSYERAIAIKVDYVDAYCNRGNALKELRQYAKALQSYDQAIAIDANHASTYCNRGIVFWALGQHQQAIDNYNRALGLQPRYAQALHNRGISLAALKRHAEAIASYDQAIAIEPEHIDAHFNRSLCYLQMGNFELGLPDYEWRWKTEQLRPNWRQFAQPLWLGQEPLQGKTILLHSEQGYGDTLHFCRYVRLVASLGARVVFEVHPALRQLLAQLEDVAQLVAQGDVLPAFDVHCPVASLPLALHTTLATIPSATYLHSDANKVAQWQARLGPRSKPRVGIVWSGNPLFPSDHHRSMALADFIKHLPTGIEYVSLKKEVNPVDLQTLKSRPDILHFGDALQNFSDTAALCDCVDLIVSTCTSVVHLAGAMGRPLWVLLPFTADWRWLLERSDSPWYPSATLYRQAQAGDWDSVLLRVAKDLQRRFATH